MKYTHYLALALLIVAPSISADLAEKKSFNDLISQTETTLVTGATTALNVAKPTITAGLNSAGAAAGNIANQIEQTSLFQSIKAQVLSFGAQPASIASFFLAGITTQKAANILGSKIFKEEPKIRQTIDGFILVASYDNIPDKISNKALGRDATNFERYAFLAGQLAANTCPLLNWKKA